MASNTMELAPWLRKQLANEDGDLLAEMFKAFANQLVGRKLTPCAALVTGSGARRG